MFLDEKPKVNRLSPIKILITGLPGSGKTFFTKLLHSKLPSETIIFNGDQIRSDFNDWDFSHEGRKRQAVRMINFQIPKHIHFVIYDFVCPREEYRKIISPDITVWMNTIPTSRYEDTNSIWENPQSATFILNNHEESDFIVSEILNYCEYKFSSIQLKTDLQLGI